VGDDLINPFFQFFQTNGSFSRTLHLGYEYGTSHKFDILGQTIFVVHSWLWLQFDHLTNLNHMWFYYLTKWTNYCIVLVAISYWLATVINMKKKSVEFKRLLLMLTLVGGATIQLHNIWSNDPVGNYPLSGFAAASCGFITLGLLNRCVNSSQWRNLLYASLAVGFSILYYEINIALLSAAFVVWLIIAMRNLRDRRFLRPICDGILLTAVPLVVVLYGRLVTSGKTAEYGGTTIGSWSRFPKTSAIAFVGNLPAGGWSLSRRFVSTVDFPSTLVIGSSLLLVVLFGYITKQILERSTSEIQLKRLIMLLSPAFAYWLTSISIQTMTDKYQNEIVEIGQTYNFYAQGFMFLTGSIAIGFLLLGKYKPYIPMVTAFLVVFGSFQYQINTQLVEAVRIGNGASVGLVNSYVSTSSDAFRCDAWKAWASGVWPEYYEQGMAVGLRASFKSFYGEEFCKTGIAPIP
jgi:hypothetical protein